MRRAVWLAMLCGALLPAGAWAENPPKGEEQEEHRLEGILTPGEQDEMLKFAKENNPDMARHLNALREENPEAFRRKINELAPMYRDPTIRDTFAKHMKTERRVHKAVEAYREAKGADKEAAKKELESALGDQFDSKLAMHEIHIRKMRQEITKLEKKIEKRRGLKGQMVKKKLEQLSGEGDDEW